MPFPFAQGSDWAPDDDNIVSDDNDMTDDLLKLILFGNLGVLTYLIFLLCSSSLWTGCGPYFMNVLNEIKLQTGTICSW